MSQQSPHNAGRVPLSFGAAPRILIVRLSALGDTLMSTPVAQALREAFPKAYIGWVVQDRCRLVVEDNPYLDKVHLWDGTVVGLFRLARELRAERYEFAFDLQGLFKSAVIPWLAHIPVRIGFSDGGEGSPFLLTHRLVPPHRAPFVAGRNLQLLMAMGIPADPFCHRMHFPLSENNRQVATHRLSEFGLLPKNFVVLAPATTRPQKHWVEERWSELVGLLFHDLNLPSVLLGGKNDRPSLESIARHCSVPLPILCDLSLKDAVAVIEQAAVLVGPDSFPIHASLAVGTPVVALFGSTDPFRFRDEQGIRVLENELPCRPCRRRPTCGGTFICMRLITADEVLAAVVHWIEQPLPTPTLKS